MAMASVGSGSKVQPSSSDVADGASAGTGPWAPTTAGLGDRQRAERARADQRAEE